MVPGFQTRWWLETTPLPLSSTNLDPLPPPASLPPLVLITSEDWKPQGSNCGAGSKRNVTPANVSSSSLSFQISLPSSLKSLETCIRSYCISHRNPVYKS
ncbi:hypothetical protein CC1G_13231 [Coprinopsis cinerea okayama7|uniref:Uncharacterized protein n=1 Tax=Coprinopsis cinerea (strain Okayama-7 / 130 / ATCC MYA-4618 / FGSC 9003) TaxID=240176 RepID=A8PI27_COPC7|nr:hypothetical protein CC1G_13231 [Coprinopsis cinerea okayama7\|eukprot:XP_001841504.1 hypothetical protein CC1G_13231 [Coprinopsis cinerea okayama7\